MGLYSLFSNDDAEKARDLANTGARAGYDQLSGLLNCKAVRGEITYGGYEQAGPPGISRLCGLA